MSHPEAPWVAALLLVAYCCLGIAVWREKRRCT